MRRIAAALLVVTVAGGCGTSSSSTNTPRRTASPVPAGTTPGLTSFLQAVPGEDLIADAFPGAANTWTLDRNFALARPWAGQYAWDEGALDLWVGTVGTTTAAGILDEWVAGAGTTIREFPFDQSAGSVTFLTPLLGAADGVPVAAVRPGRSDLPVLFGAGSGLLAGSADSRLVRRVPLAPDQQYTISWWDGVSLDAFITFRLDDALTPPGGPRYQVVLRDPATGAPLGDPLYVTTAPGAGATLSHGVAVSTAPGGTPAGSVDLSFELRSGGWGFATIDAVTVTTLGGWIPLANGDFEGPDLGPWTAVGPPRPQQVRSAPRIVAVDPSGATTLAITRTFLAPPATPWARMVDVLRNDGAAPVATSVLYVTRLGASVPGVALAADGRAVVARDVSGLCRDLGLVFGSGRASFDAADPTVASYLFVVHDVVVPARGAVALVHFVVQLGQGSTGAEHVPAGTIAACEAVTAGVRSDPAYLSDLEPGVLELVQNL
jgi:hypothetical protein